MILDRVCFDLFLKKLQDEPHRSYAEYRTPCRTLPWPTEPRPGAAPPHTDEVTAGRENNPGCTPEQAADEARLWARIR
ncbi:hypothetical protein [Streptomyces hydrogenans]|uniref:hypothetical protein n=1 Tax=Streptomyces hydrogenans TaxID=1873719 RepID=UPI0035E0AF14